MHMVEMVILQNACTKKLKIEDLRITQHHLDHQIQILTNKAFITEGHPGQVIGFTALIHMSTLIMSFIPPTLLLVTWKHATGTVYEANLLSSIMKEQTIKKTALPSTEMSDGIKSKFEAWMESIKYAAQMSGQNTICIAFSKLTSSPLLTANRLKAISPNLM